MDVIIDGRRYVPAPSLEVGGDMARELRAARNAAGYSLSAAAKLAGLSKAQLWELEDGRQNNPRRNTMAALMRLYGLSASVFLGRGQPTHGGLTTCDMD